MEYIKYAGIALAALVLGWLLWEQGLLPMNSKRAAAFVGRVYGNPIRLTMTRATGTLRRKVLLKPGSRTFVLEDRLTEGTVTVTLREHGTGRQWKLDRQFPSVTFEAARSGFGKGYLLTVRYEKAGGDLTLSWQ